MFANIVVAKLLFISITLASDAVVAAVISLVLILVRIS
jgi:hypothetical protein